MYDNLVYRVGKDQLYYLIVVQRRMRSYSSYISSLTSSVRNVDKDLRERKKFVKTNKSRLKRVPTGDHSKKTEGWTIVNFITGS